MGWLKQISDTRLARRKRRYEKRLNTYSDSYKAKSARNSLYLQELRKKPTKSEIDFGNWMYENKIQFKFQKGFLKPFHRIVDFYIPIKKIIIEIDGKCHDKFFDNGITFYKDKKKDLIWREKGYKTIRIKNEEIDDGSFVEKFYAQYK